MPLLTFNPPVAPAPGSTRTPQVKLLKAEFGDGYTQTAPDGLNHIRRVYGLKWDVLTAGQAKAITDFLEARGGGVEPFLYRHPRDPAALQFTCEEWAANDLAAGLVSLTATLRQSFAIAT